MRLIGMLISWLVCGVVVLVSMTTALLCVVLSLIPVLRRGKLERDALR